MGALLWVVIAMLGAAVVVLVLGRKSPTAPGGTVDARGAPTTGQPGPAQDTGLGQAIGAAVAAAFNLANSIFPQQK